MTDFSGFLQSPGKGGILPGPMSGQLFDFRVIWKPKAPADDDNHGAEPSGAHHFFK